MKKSWILALTIICLLVLSGISVSQFIVKWVFINRIYSSPEIRDRLRIVPEIIHRPDPPDEGSSNPLSLGYASFKQPQNLDVSLYKEKTVYNTIWMCHKEWKLFFYQPVSNRETYEMQSIDKLTFMTKSQWRENRTLKATDHVEHTIMGMSDLKLYYFQGLPLSYFQVFFLNKKQFSKHIVRLGSKIEEIPPRLKRIVPFEFEHIVGVVCLFYEERKFGNSGFIYLDSLDRQTSQQMMFLNLSENSNDVLEPIWQVLAGYQFNFETCPGDEEIRKLIEESDIPEISITAASYPEMQKE